MPEAKTLKDLMIIRANNRDFLDSINGNLGTALGFKRRTGQPLSNQPAILVFVPEKINPKWIPASQIIPKKLEGPDGLWCALDVVAGGRAEEEEEIKEDQSELVERLRGWDEQIWCGSQISHWVDQSSGMYSIGTLGSFAKSRDNGEMGFLTNQHVGVAPGKKIFHPIPDSTLLGTTDSVVEYVPDEFWYGPFVDEPDTFVRVDCAFVKMIPELNSPDNINTQMMGVGQLGPVKHISLDDMSIIGQKVLRVGRTTGLRRGMIVAFGYEWYDENDATAYTDLLIAGDDGIAFSTHGDSGSLIVMDNPELNPIGLLWGGWQEKLRTGYAQENWTYGIALSRVLDALQIDLVT